MKRARAKTLYGLASVFLGVIVMVTAVLGILKVSDGRKSAVGHVEKGTSTLAADLKNCAENRCEITDFTWDGYSVAAYRKDGELIQVAVRSEVFGPLTTEAVKHGLNVTKGDPTHAHATFWDNVQYGGLGLLGVLAFGSTILMLYSLVDAEDSAGEGMEFRFEETVKLKDWGWVLNLGTRHPQGYMPETQAAQYDKQALYLGPIDGRAAGYMAPWARMRGSVVVVLLSVVGYIVLPVGMFATTGGLVAVVAWCLVGTRGERPQTAGWKYYWGRLIADSRWSGTTALNIKDLEIAWGLTHEQAKEASAASLVRNGTVKEFVERAKAPEDEHPEQDTGQGGAQDPGHDTEIDLDAQPELTPEENFAQSLTSFPQWEPQT